MIKRVFLFLVLFTLCTTVSGQWSSEWSTSNISSSTASGWLSFQKTGDEWNNCFYQVGAENFQVMHSTYSSTALYTYTFTAPEVLAGNQVYSLGVDLTGDNITEFYVLGYYGNAEPYRQSMKIFDITTGSILFERNDAAYYFTQMQQLMLSRKSRFKQNLRSSKIILILLTQVQILIIV